MNKVSGFSKLTKIEKIDWLKSQLPKAYSLEILPDFWLANPETQRLIEEFSENTIGNFILPFGIAPNFLIDEKIYSVPFVIEESSVVAASAKSAKFWSNRGGFKSKIISTLKNGQVHFNWKGDFQKLQQFFERHKESFLSNLEPLTKNMVKRGGGVRSLELKNCTDRLENYYQLFVSFDTCDAMGANFINSVLENLGSQLKAAALKYPDFADEEKDLEINMCILSNYTPECLVRVEVECPLEELNGVAGDMSGREFARRFKQAVDIARADVRRAVTHNKGIYNGIDAVVLATGNDFRAVEAAGHAYAAKDGQYRGLSECTIEDDTFRFFMEIPLALGTVGGLTSLHPMAKVSLEMLDNPDAQTLMKIVAAAGLAQNFGALRSLVTTGIQQGHMKMHLLNILNQLKASKAEIKAAKTYFIDKTVSFSAVRDFLAKSDTLH